MRTVVTHTSANISKLTISPSQKEIRIKICESDFKNKDIILSGIDDIIKNNKIGILTHRSKIILIDGNYCVDFYDNKKLSIQL
jgi:hypothetical protein